MRIRWRNLELPNRVDRDDSSATPTYARFRVEPFERGFGTTVGNSLRRILLSSLEGCAVTRVRIKGVRHEFSSLEGVLEDVTEIILNVKSLIVRITSQSDEPRKMRVVRNTPGPVRAGDIQTDASVDIINKDLVLCEVTEKNIDFEMELEVRKGRGYVTAVENITEDMEAGTIPVDSVFSPVTRVRYATEDTRVGQKTNYDRLVMEIWTNGTITPDLALVEAAKILRKHLNPFVQYSDLGVALEVGDHGGGGSASGSAMSAGASGLPPEVEEKLSMPIQQLMLSVRATNCLESESIETVRQLVQRTEDDLLKIRSFGRTSLREVVRKLEGLGLRLGMTPSDMRDLAAKTTGQPAAS
jgi:DNA-directed RNA polymerase subunit alpha